MFFASELLSSLGKVKFSKQEFFADKLVSDIKYYPPSYHSNNTFYRFIDQLDYVLANYFVDFEITKDNIDRFLSNPLMFLLIKKLSYQNADK